MAAIIEVYKILGETVADLSQRIIDLQKEKDMLAAEIAVLTRKLEIHECKSKETQKNKANTKTLEDSEELKMLKAKLEETIE